MAMADRIVVNVLLSELRSGLLKALCFALGTALLLVLLPGVDVLFRRLEDGRTDGPTVVLTGLLAAVHVAAAGLVLVHVLGFPFIVCIVFPCMLSAIMLRWWTNISQTQTRAWVGRQGLQVKDNLLKLESAVVPILEHVASALNDKMQAASEDAPIRSMQPAETAALLQAMQARINALEGQLGETRKKLEETRKGLQEAERRRVADSRELRGRVEKGEKEVMNVKAELLVVKWEMEGSLEATKEELEGKLGESKEEQEGNIVTAKKELEGGLIEVKGELIAMKGELVTVKRQLHEDGAEKVGKEGVDVQVEVAVSWRSAAAEQGQSSTHEELAVGEQLRKSQGDVSSAWQKIRAAATLDLKGQAHLSDALLAHVATMTHLKHVHIDMTSGFTSQGIKCLYSLPHLESLELKGTTVTASTLEGIGAASSSLKLLYLNQAAVTDAGLPHLTALAFLKTLILYKCEGVTCPGMVLVGRMTSLEELYLFGSGVKNHGLRFLAPLTRLKMLVLPSSITDAGLEHLQQLVALELLDVSNSVVRKKGVKLLKGLPRLKQVRAGSASLQLLRTALPGVVVSKDLLPGTISGDVS